LKKPRLAQWVEQHLEFVNYAKDDNDEVNWHGCCDMNSEILVVPKKDTENVQVLTNIELQTVEVKVLKL
jgi:23S rRNA G2445 N2-methylase RlmL